MVVFEQVEPLSCLIEASLVTEMALSRSSSYAFDASGPLAAHFVGSVTNIAHWQIEMSIANHCR